MQFKNIVFSEDRNNKWRINSFLMYTSKQKPWLSDLSFLSLEVIINHQIHNKQFGTSVLKFH